MTIINCKQILDFFDESDCLFESKMKKIDTPTIRKIMKYAKKC